eukprot:jgi/Undpi1/11397/HiC_scaffold_30.g13694.m1
MPSPSDDRHHPSSIRNRDVILQELSKWEGGSGSGEMLDIASGTGCHVEAFAKALPGWTFQPSEYDKAQIPEIATTIEKCGSSNILPPVLLDVRSDPASWPRPTTKAEGGGGALWDAAMCINMIHIAPKECTMGLFKGAASGLKMGKHLFLYGPFMLHGVLIPDSNKSFDEYLKGRSEGQWSIRDAEWVAKLADEQGLELTAMTLMPANNFFVVFTKVRDAETGTDEASINERASRVGGRVSAVVKPAWEALVASAAGK